MTNLWTEETALERGWWKRNGFVRSLCIFLQLLSLRRSDGYGLPPRITIFLICPTIDFHLEESSHLAQTRVFERSSR